MEDIFQQVLRYSIGAIGFLIVYFVKGIRDDFKSMRQDIGDMTNSVNDLNQKIAVVIKDQAWHKEEIDEIKSRLNKIET